MPAGPPKIACSIAPTTSRSQMNTNGLAEPRSAISRGRSNSAVIWLRVVSPRIVPTRNTTCSSCGCVAPIVGEHLLDQALVVRVRELLVAAHRVVLGEPRRIVGVITVGRAARGDDDPAARRPRRRPRARSACRARPRSTRARGSTSRPGVTMAARCTTVSIACRRSSVARARGRGCPCAAYSHAGQAPLGRHLAHVARQRCSPGRRCAAARRASSDQSAAEVARRRP